MNWFFSNRETIRCKDKTVRYVYKDLDHAFPLYTKDWKARFDTALKGVRTLQASATGEVAAGLSGLLVSINDHNASVQFNCRAVYITYAANPCEMDEWLKQRMADIISNDDTITQFMTDIDHIAALIHEGAQKETILASITSVVKKITRKPYLPTDTVQKALQDVKVWKKKQ